MPPKGYRAETVSSGLALEVLELLTHRCRGPSEGFATLCLAIKMLQELNARLCNEPEMTADQVCQEFAVSYKSIQGVESRLQ